MTHSAGRWKISRLSVVIILLVPSVIAAPAPLEVGPGHAFERIEDAHAKSKPGDVILVYPRADRKPYERVAVFVQQPRISFRGVVGKDGARVTLAGEGFDYSGEGRVPRAIFQFNRGADGCALDGFELFGAHNASHNGAGVRVNQANHVAVRDCDIHHNDMGVMSNGDGTPDTAADLLLVSCRIHHNGDAREPGYSHNLYLGGTSATLRFCEVFASLTGHNVKSRAHHTRVEYSYVHDSANREFDLVDAADTAGPESHAVLLGNVIAKDPACKGNREVIHFGQDGGGDHDGTLHVIHNTIVTPFGAAVVTLSAPKARARLVGNIVWDRGAGAEVQALAAARAGADLKNVAGARNWLSGGFGGGLAAAGLDPRENAAHGKERPPFANADAGDYRLAQPMAGVVNVGLPVKQLAVPDPPGAAPSGALLGWQYRWPLQGEKRRDDGKPDLGAYEFGRP